MKADLQTHQAQGNKTASFFGKSEANAAFFQPAVIQPQLTINEPGDQYEQEADAMAERVMRMETAGGAPLEEEHPIQTMPLAISRLQRQESEEEEPVQMMPLSIQRKCAECEQEEQVQAMPLMRKSEGGGYQATSKLTYQLYQSKGGGSSLPRSTLNYMNQAFGSDFSNVRVHTASQAQEMSQGIQAKAFTHGADIYFNQGQYSPESSEGKRLLAHELTHVVQQGERDFLKRIQRRTRNEALQFGQQLNTRYPNWLTYLPNCPCTFQQAMQSPNDWRDATSLFTSRYHPGADKDVRSARGHSSGSAGTNHGQQCTYDTIGNLITEGAAAGTPDVWAPDDGIFGTHFANHQRDDVETFNHLGWRIYTQYWQPNNANNCTPNAGNNTRMNSGRYRVIAVADFRQGYSYVPRTVNLSDDIQVVETGRRSSGWFSGVRLEVIPSNSAAITLFGGNSPRFLPIEMLNLIP